MSVFKFACPVCGQHIQCDATKSGSQMECPTCFRKIVVPQAPVGEDSKLILTASQVQSRPVRNTPSAGDAPGVPGSSNRATTMFLIVLVVIACAAAGAVFVFREGIFKRPGQAITTRTNAPPVPVANDTNWTMELADRKIPATPVAGRINGQSFALEKATVQGGLLNFRQGPKWPPDAGLTIFLFAKQGEDLAGQSVNIDMGRTNAPKIMLRSKDDQQQPVTHHLQEGYALRIEFGQVTGGRLPGKIYLCTPDDAKSWVAGTFEAEIRKPQPPKPPRTPPSRP